ncbi:MAG TPA: ankyrin repeat domain-containing protein [Steroidobacteraceae bacterium]|jgi:hypothetical protein
MTSQEPDAADANLLEQYRHASSAEGLGPTESVRAAILAEGRRIAQQRAAAPPNAFDTSQPAANQSRWKIAAFGTFGVAVLGGLLMVPRWLPTAPPQIAASRPAAASRSTAAPAAADAVAPSPVSPPTQLPANAPQSTAAALAKRETALPDRRAAPSAKSSDAQLAEVARDAPADEPKTASSNVASQADSVAVTGARPSRQHSISARAAAPAAAPPPAESPMPTPLQSAVAAEDAGRVAVLLDEHAATEDRDGLGRTPLMLATMQGQIGIVRLLLAHGADPNAADKSGNTPLQQARKGQFTEIARLLEDAGAH